MLKQTNYARSIFTLLLIVCLFAVAAVLKLTADFFIPVTVAMLLAFVFYPLCKKIHSLHVPWVLCVILMLGITCIVLYFIGTLLISSIKAILSTYPKYEMRFMSIYKTFATTFRIPYDENSTLFMNLWNSLNVRTALQNFAIAFSTHIMSFSKVLMLVTLFIVFLLLELNNMKEKIDRAFTEQRMNQKILSIARNTVSEVTHFISIKFVISLLTGLIVGLGTFAIHMDFPVIWGFVAFIMNLFPTFGSAISWALTTLFAIMQFYPSWEYVIFVALLVLVVNMVLGNIIEPRWEGSDLGLSPFVILVSLSFWGWMWSFIGMILAVPIMVILKIICENVEFLNPVAILIGNVHKKGKDSAVCDQAEKLPDEPAAPDVNRVQQP